MVKVSLAPMGQLEMLSLPINKPDTAAKLEEANCRVEFALLAHWQEYYKWRSAWIERGDNHLCRSSARIGNMVVAILILWNEERKAERLALVAIPFGSWAAASPKEMIVEFV
jgi:hypothetical protein